MNAPLEFAPAEPAAPIAADRMRAMFDAQRVALARNIYPSRSGAYHAEHGFRTSSKAKPVLHQARFNRFGLVRPPCGRQSETMISLLKRYF